LFLNISTTYIVLFLGCCTDIASIIERKRRDGSIAYLAQIVIKKKGKIIFHDSRTSDTRKAAGKRVKKRIKEVRGADDDLGKLKNNPLTLGDAIADRRPNRVFYLHKMGLHGFCISYVG